MLTRNDRDPVYDDESKTTKVMFGDLYNFECICKVPENETLVYNYVVSMFPKDSYSLYTFTYHSTRHRSKMYTNHENLTQQCEADKQIHMYDEFSNNNTNNRTEDKEVTTGQSNLRSNVATQTCHSQWSLNLMCYNIWNMNSVDGAPETYVERIQRLGKVVLIVS